MEKGKNLPSVPGRPFKVCHQFLCIRDVNFQRQSLIAFVELVLLPLQTNVRRIRLNCKQCRIFRIVLNDTFDVNFTYNDPLLKICPEDSTQKDLIFFNTAHLNAVDAVDADRGNGEISIKIPPQVMQQISEKKQIRVGIEYTLERPQGGIHFVLPECEGNLEGSGAHMYTYGYENSSRLWFPCVDSYCEPCTWRMEFTVDSSMIAVSCGDLAETVYSSDTKKKTYRYDVSIPTSAPNIGLAVGPFEVLVHPEMPKVTHFCLPGLLPLLKHSTSFLHKAFEFYEKLLPSGYPYSCYKQVFVDEFDEEAKPYASMSILSTNCLHSQHIIDQTFVSREIMAHAVAVQFFGCFVSAYSPSDVWLSKGISMYLSGQYLGEAFGNNEYRHRIHNDMRQVMCYEEKHFDLVLDYTCRSPGGKGKDGASYFSAEHVHTTSPVFNKILEKKSHLVIRMLENRIGRSLLQQVLDKLLSLALSAAEQEVTPNLWCDMFLSTSSFQEKILADTGKDISTFLQEWVRQGGHPKFSATFVYNNRKNILELEIRQPVTEEKGIRRYIGPLTVTVQEHSGTFKHEILIGGNVARREIPCHLKTRKKKINVRLCNGAEVAMDLSAIETNSPVLWVRIDPEMQLIRRIVIGQHDYQWRYMLRYERDVAAQKEAIEALEKLPEPESVSALIDTIEDERCFYRVRCQAAFSLQRVENQIVSTSDAIPALMTIFRKMFGSQSCPRIVRINDFSNLQHYFLQKNIAVAIAGSRDIRGICPPKVFEFLLDLLEYNDNSKNQYSDNYYRAALIKALVKTATPVIAALVQAGRVISADSLCSSTRLILEKVTRCLSMDELLPCYKYTVTVSCLKAIRKLQKLGHLPRDPSLFREYAHYGMFVEVRMAAIEALADFVSVDGGQEVLNFLLDIVENDPVPSVRYRSLLMVSEKPLFPIHKPSPLNTEELVRRLWKFMTSSTGHDSLVRRAAVDFYRSIYGLGMPTCLRSSHVGLHQRDVEVKELVQLPTRSSVFSLGPAPTVGNSKWSAASTTHHEERHKKIKSKNDSNTDEGQESNINVKKQRGNAAPPLQDVRNSSFPSSKSRAREEFFCDDVRPRREVDSPIRTSVFSLEPVPIVWNLTSRATPTMHLVKRHKKKKNKNDSNTDQGHESNINVKNQRENAAPLLQDVRNSSFPSSKSRAREEFFCDDVRQRREVDVKESAESPIRTSVFPLASAPVVGYSTSPATPTTHFVKRHKKKKNKRKHKHERSESHKVKPFKRRKRMADSPKWRSFLSTESKTTAEAISDENVDPRCKVRVKETISPSEDSTLKSLSPSEITPTISNSVKKKHEKERPIPKLRLRIAGGSYEIV